MQEEPQWQAVLQRDTHADGTFVYAVRSTGIYCKPSCPSRRPNREQVSFFICVEEAERAGYRACYRCQPRRKETPLVELTQQLCAYIEEHLTCDLTLARLGKAVGMSPYHLQRTFKQATGISPRQYAEARRLECLKERLRAGEAVTSALYNVGYGSSSRLYERAPDHLGMTPATYRKGGSGMDIVYTIVDCPQNLGRLLVAATETGICAVSLGDDDEELVKQLEREYPAAEAIRRDDEGPRREWIEAILQYLAGTSEENGRQLSSNVPLDIQATAFQWRVWQQLRAIPYGETRSYGEIARALGDSKKARAVANACASNPVALIIPCHRVVRENGNRGGYRWGSERKQHLLAQEQEQA
jgi:AraC family transcriptional regulator of adaptative response/methylated-DNA-[protein]-cysteine methyltransferase